MTPGAALPRKTERKRKHAEHERHAAKGGPVRRPLEGLARHLAILGHDQGGRIGNHEEGGANGPGPRRTARVWVNQFEGAPWKGQDRPLRRPGSRRSRPHSQYRSPRMRSISDRLRVGSPPRRLSSSASSTSKTFTTGPATGSTCRRYESTTWTRSAPRRTETNGPLWRATIVSNRLL